MVKIYYGSDEAVQQDVEIQGFVKDVACFGMNNSDSEYRLNLSKCQCMFVCGSMEYCLYILYASLCVSSHLYCKLL